MNNKLFCEKPEHFIKQFKYCQYCAIKGKQARVVFFCDRCHTTVKAGHNSHRTEVCFINNQKFLNPLQQLKGILRQQVQTVKQKSIQKKINNFQQILNDLKNTKMQFLKLLDQKQLLTKLLLNADIMKWLLSISFWQAGQAQTFMHFQKTKMPNIIRDKFLQCSDKIKIIYVQVDPVLEPDFSVEWPENNAGIEVQNELKGLNQDLQRLSKEKQIYKFMIKMFSSYNIAQCFSTYDQSGFLLQRYPNSKVLLLAQIRLLQLLPNRQEQIVDVLNKIVKIQAKFQFSDLYYYYMAMSKWQLIEIPTKEDGLLFFQLKNKSYYKLLKVDQYIDNLNKALGVREKPIYYASLGIGYIVKGSLQQAIRVFRMAISLSENRNDAVDLNKFWVQCHLNTSDRQFQSIMQSLQTRTLQFITNISKYFKKQKINSQLVICCQQLILREPNNDNFKIQFIKSILNYSSSLKEIKGEDKQKISKAELMIIELKRARQNQANKLEKRLLRMRAKQDFQKSKYNDAIDGFQQLAKGTCLTSCSDYYNYASSLFKSFVDSNCTDEDLIKQAYESISKGIDLNQKAKYHKLKYFICCYMNKFNEADLIYNKILKDDKRYGIDQKQYQTLLNHVKQNLEDDFDSRWNTPLGE